MAWAQRDWTANVEDWTAGDFVSEIEPDLESVPSFDNGVTSDDSSDDDDSLDSEDDSVGSDDCVQLQFQTPCKRATTFVEQNKTAEKIRDLMYVLDDELQPMSLASFMNTKHAADQLFKTPGKTAENIHDSDEELQPLSPPFHGQQQKALQILKPL